MNETADVKLVCKAEGNPVPEVKFMFNGNALVNFESKYDKHTKEIWINLRNMTKKFNGTYSCYLNETMHKSIDIMIRCIFNFFVDMKLFFLHHFFGKFFLFFKSLVLKDLKISIAHIFKTKISIIFYLVKKSINQHLFL